MSHSGYWFIDPFWVTYRDRLLPIGISKETVMFMKGRYYSDINDYDLFVTLKAMKKQYPEFMEQVAAASRATDAEAALEAAEKRLQVAKTLHPRLGSDPLANELGRLGPDLMWQIGEAVNKAQGGGHRRRRRSRKSKGRSRKSKGRKSKRRRTKRRRSR